MIPLRTFVGVDNPTAVASEMARVANLYKMSASGLGATPLEAVAAASLAALAAVLVVRGVVGYYVGKQFGRPKASAAAGAVFGAPGVGAVALFGRGDKRR